MSLYFFSKKKSIYFFQKKKHIFFSKINEKKLNIIFLKMEVSMELIHTTFNTYLNKIKDYNNSLWEIIKRDCSDATFRRYYYDDLKTPEDLNSLLVRYLNLESLYNKLIEDIIYFARMINYYNNL